MSHVRRAVACSIALAVTLVAFSGPVGAADPASNTVAANAVTWLKAQQVAGGGIGPIPSFETRDAALAVAEQAQTGATWNPAEALAAVQAVKFGGNGPTPLDYVEADPQASSSPGAAGKTILLTANPLGIDPTAFGATNLVTVLEGADGCSNVTDPTFNGLLYLLLGEKIVCGSVPAAGLATVRAGQRSDGGWNYLGDQNPSVDSDNDTTAVAIEALVAGGAGASDPAVHAALAFFAQTMQADGAWQSFGADDPNSTALALIGVAAAGFDPVSSCWRDTVMPAAAGSAYANPDAWLRSQQLPDGQIQSPNDAFLPINSFATSQTVQGLLRSWLPVFRAPVQTCASAPPVTDNVSIPPAPGTPTAPTPVITQPAFTG